MKEVDIMTADEIDKRIYFGPDGVEWFLMEDILALSKMQLSVKLALEVNKIGGIDECKRNTKTGN